MTLQGKDSDFTLLNKIRNGDHNAFAALYHRYGKYLYAVCTRYISCDEDAQDILQEAFIKIYNSISSFQISETASVKAWLLKIVINEALKFLRDKQKVCFTDIDGIELPDTTDFNTNTAAIPSDEIYKMIRSLPAGYRTVFNLYVIEGKSHKEIADMLGIKEDSSASQLHRAKTLLAQKIKDYLNKTN